ncbi:MAG TPA: helix-turn-helix domain-containing protein, partial [Candidatus Obscuribacterales bacterium]
WTCRLERLADEDLHGYRQESHYGVLWLEELVKGTAELDFVHLQLGPAQALFWAPGQICRFDLAKASGWRLEFGLDTFCQSGLDDALLESLGLFAPLTDSPLLKIPPAEMAELTQILRWWEKDNTLTARWHRQLAGSYLRLLLLRCGQLADRPRLLPAIGESEIWPRFRQLLESQFRRWHQVSNYADALAVTPGHLNELVRQASGRSAKRVIQERLMLEARRAAWFSQDSLKQIAYDLGFEDPAYFSRLFRRCSGQNFTDFRNRIREKQGS